jgi:flagellar hook-associated protein 2
MAVDSNLVAALGAGSGIDIKSLAKGLTDAEKVPKQNAIQAKIDRSEARISGYSAVMAALNVFKTSVEAMDSTTDFAAMSSRNSQPSAFSVVTTALASPGSHSIEVLGLAQGQRSSLGSGFSNITSPVNGGNAFSLSIAVGPAGSQTTTTVNIDAANTNLSAVATAINQSGAGVRAQVLDTGVVGAADRYRLVLSGGVGADNAFTVTTTATDPVEFAQATAAGQEATNSSVRVNGITVSRSNNTVADVIPGVTLELQATTSSAASLSLTRDASGVKDKVKNFVQSYNDMVSDFGILTGKKSDDPEDVFSGSLAGDSTARAVLTQIRQIVFSESETKGSTVTNFRSLGVTVDRNGVLTLDEAQLDKAISENHEEVITTLAGRQTATENGETVTKRGLGVTMAAKLRDLMGPSGLVMTQSTSNETQVTRYKKELEALETRMEKILARYTKQFAAMESLVGQISAMRENLKGQFEGLANAYKK